MDNVRSKIAAALEPKHGPCIVQLDLDFDICFKILVNKHPDHIIYIRPERGIILCCYAHLDDVRRRFCSFCVSRRDAFEQPTKEDNTCLCSKDADVRAWKQQGALQMVRSYKDDRGLLFTAVEYVDAVVERIVCMGVLGRDTRVKTFREAEFEMKQFPEPMPLASVAVERREVSSFGLLYFSFLHS